MSKSPEDFANEISEAVATRAVERFLLDWNLIAGRCDSPIEKVLAAALIVALERGPTFYRRAYFHDVAPVALADGVHLCPQAEIGKYRVDFLLTVRAGELVQRVAVECDGHDFHEKTKEQAARDKKRDRDLAERGVQVVRFTGSEIWNRPDECADQVVSILETVAGA